MFGETKESLEEISEKPQVDYEITFLHVQSVAKTYPSERATFGRNLILTAFGRAMVRQWVLLLLHAASRAPENRSDLIRSTDLKCTNPAGRYKLYQQIPIFNAWHGPSATSARSEHPISLCFDLQQVLTVVLSVTLGNDSVMVGYCSCHTNYIISQYWIRLSS